MSLLEYISMWLQLDSMLVISVAPRWLQRDSGSAFFGFPGILSGIGRTCCQFKCCKSDFKGYIQ